MQYKEFVREMFTRSQETLKEDYEIERKKFCSAMIPETGN